jgi:nucleotide-binding universal stress UspA family protein
LFPNNQEEILSNSKKSLLLALNDSVSSRAVLDYIIDISFSPEDLHVTLLHVFRKPSASEELMGKKFTDKRVSRISNFLQTAKEKLVERGFNADKIEIAILSDPCPTVADGIIEQCKKENYDMVIIGRKRMSKAEEFVMGDVSIKLVRGLEGTAVLVVKSE